MSERRGGTRDDWDTHWSRYDAAARLNPAQAFRRRLILRTLDLPPAGAGARVLELGCGQGDLATELLERHSAVELCGLDRSATGVGLAQSRAGLVGAGRARFLVRELERPLELPTELLGWASHAVCSELLEHVDDPVAVLRHARPYVARGGRLVVSVPGGPRSAFDRTIGHRRHFRCRDLHVLLEAAGYDVCEVVGAGFPGFNLYRLGVVAAGGWLVRGAARPALATSGLGRAAAAAVGAMLSLSNDSGTLGWQRIAVGRRP